MKSPPDPKLDLTMRLLMALSCRIQKGWQPLFLTPLPAARSFPGGWGPSPSRNP